jgi:ATP-dependent Clp protease ATP-binding subunit ClpC
MDLAMSAARELDHTYVGTEHLLLGLLREEKGIAAQVLMRMGVTAESVLGELKRDG